MRRILLPNLDQLGRRLRRVSTVRVPGVVPLGVSARTVEGRMRVVSLNLDHGDAAVVRRAIRKAIDGCRCGQESGTEPCNDCQALGATLQELDRLVQRPTLGRTPLLTLVAASRCLSNTSDVIATEEESGGDHGFRLLAGDGGRGAR